MADKMDAKKQYKELYQPPAKPVIVDVPAFPFIVLEGRGDPNTSEEFAQAVQALYSLSYAVKMSYRSDDPPPGYEAYTVFPLEGVWSLYDKDRPVTDKSNFVYSLMIRQPGFLTPALFEKLRAQTEKKKPNPLLARARLEVMAEGLCCQMMHMGPYDDEPASFAQMEAYCRENGYIRAAKTHREIYISDPRRVAPEKRKTVLRFPVMRA